MHCSSLMIDADFNPAAGWEIVLRFDAESMEGAWSDLSDSDLRTVVGPHIASALILERDQAIGR